MRTAGRQFIMAASIAGCTIALLPIPAAAQQPLDTAISRHDVGALTAIGEGSGSEAMLARGVLASFRMQDDDALAYLAAAASGDLTPPLRRHAWMTIAAVRMRQGRFADAAAAIRAARQAAPGSGEEDAKAARGLQTAELLAGVSPMRAQIAAAGETPLRHDRAGLPRVRVTINGQEQEIVLDTGASLSLLTESAARRLGLRMLEGETSVRAAGDLYATARIGIAETLEIAGGSFSDVVFIVVPDGALVFAGGLYRIPGLIGFPILSRLGRIEFRGDQLRHRRSSRELAQDSNLLVSGSRPYALLGANGHPVRMLVDTGARRSTLTELATTEFPALLEGARRRDVRVRGAGGSRTYDGAAVIPRLAVNVGARVVTLENVRVVGDGDQHRYGIIGQDVLRAGCGFAIDFDAMRLELLC